MIAAFTILNSILKNIKLLKIKYFDQNDTLLKQESQVFVPLTVEADIFHNAQTDLNSSLDTKKNKRK
jgi:hypothetical protein